jgi:hypothetical protein
VTLLAKQIAEKGKYQGHVIINGHVTPKPKLEGCTGGTTPINHFVKYGNFMEIISHSSPALSFAPFLMGFGATWSYKM